MTSALATPAIMTKLHGRTAAGVPRWVVRAAYAAALTALPSGIWRIAAMNFGVPLVEHGAPPPGGHAPTMFDAQWWYIIGLSVVSEAVAFLTVGLVAEWGEVWPRWIPGLGGRRVPVLAAVVPAGIGAVVLLVFPYALIMSLLGMKINGEPDGLIVNGWQTVVFYLTYAPLALWGPLLAVVTAHYYRRRTGGSI
ncbi:MULTISPECIES: hypothetical protein [Streptosporangium]|uniref:DUF3995 domain-containing protein n=1 Tax=Streptosporangium brasiliense TaxID=47480 RepID=A0ABT9QYG1_9ACTN|nr:hypothetical protein [Streptosporangium brasiliense]MDP9862021.1 hypothetical protein [Streptosporangium brasiliense]